MGYIQRFFKSGDQVDRVGSSAHQIDRILAELGRLYIERQKMLRLGTQAEIQTITEKITALKSQLAQL